MSGAATSNVSFGAEFKNIMQSSSAWINLGLPLFLGGVTVYASGFLPEQMSIANHLPPALGGTIAGLFPISMGLGMMCLPSLAGWWGRKASGVVFMIFTLAVWLVYLLKGNWSAVGLVLIAILFGFAFESSWPLSLAIQETMPGVTPSNMGVAAGAFSVSNNISVLLLPVILGAVSQRAGLAGGCWGIFVCYLLGLVAFLFVKVKKV